MVAASYTWPVDREEIRRRLAHLPPLEELLTADDLEKQRDNARALLRPAAVLVLVVNHAAGPTVVFTQRTSSLPAHAGQISFPGGRVEEGDDSLEATALRESQEEVGLDPARVEVLGRLPEYRTSTGFHVTPVVGWIDPPVEFTPDPSEVADLFEVPLAFLLDPKNHRHENAYYKGRLRHYWAMPFGSRFIWGATAGMLVTFQRVLESG